LAKKNGKDGNTMKEKNIYVIYRISFFFLDQDIIGHRLCTMKMGAYWMVTRNR
jgi:hypothetical protein